MKITIYTFSFIPIFVLNQLLFSHLSLEVIVFYCASVLNSACTVALFYVLIIILTLCFPCFPTFQAILFPPWA